MSKRDAARRNYIVAALVEAGSMFESDARSYLAGHDAARRAETLAEAADEMDAHCEKYGVLGVGDRLRRMAASAPVPVQSAGDATGEAPLSRFHSTPLQVHEHLASILAEDVHLRYQQAVGGRATEEAAKDQRMEAAALELRKPMSAMVFRSAANHIDPLKGGGPYPSQLIRFGETGGSR